MTAVLRRLQSHIGYTITEKIEQELPQWEFSHFLAKQDTSYFEPFVRHHPVLNFEYSVFCTKLAHDIFALERDPTPHLTNEILVEKIATALILSELLAHLYRHYLTVPREVARLEAEQAIYRNWLNNSYFRFPQPTKPTTKTAGFFAQKVREKTAQVNWLRLFATRTRRVFATAILIPTVRDLNYLYHFISIADQYARPAIAYFSWLFYIPRLIINIVLLLKHLIPGKWMNEEEKKLSFMTRLQGQLQRRWFELGNDSIWFAGSLLNCFVFTGTLAPFGMYLAISLALFDALWVGLRAYIELRRLKELELFYRKKEAALTDDEHAAELEELKEYQQQLQQYIDFEWQRLLLNVTSVTCLFFAMCLAFPLITNPVIPFIGASLVITITLLTYIKVQLLEKERPVNPIMKLAEPQYADLLKNKGFFHARNLAPSSQTLQEETVVEDPFSPIVTANNELTC